MTLTPGTRLGPYEIVSALGAGGMGEVYRATDTHLKRAVAIKVLPASVAADADRLARFQREAEVLAALNHPNIAAIYGLEKTALSTSSGQADCTALVMELVEGEDLSAAIARGPIALPEALPIARQIAEALEAAHEQGIVHRDLKPANVKVRADGMVKVLDFGLAKALEPVGAGVTADAMNSPTMTVRATQMGMILGTAAYMAPEQARGKAVDKRADIWAFGAVLFEMLGGTRPFDGEDPAEMMGAVIHKEPDWARLPAATPPSIGAVLRRCLQKDPKQRLRDIGDVRLALDGAFETAASPAAMAAKTAAPDGRLVWLALGVMALAAIALAIPAAQHWRESAPPQLSGRFNVSLPGRPQGNLALSPSGRLLAFTTVEGGSRRVWIRPLNALDARPIPGTDNAEFPFWSPDEEHLAFFAQGKLKKIAIAGGPAQVLCDAPTPRGGTWNQDGVIVFAPNIVGGLSRIAADGGVPVPVTTPADSHQSHRYPEFIAGGSRFLFVIDAVPEAAGLYVGSLDGAAPVRLLPDSSHAVYVPSASGAGTGALLFTREGAVMALPFDAGTLRATGGAMPVAPDVIQGETAGFAAFAASDTGVLLYRSGTALRTQTLVWFNRAGTQVATKIDPQAFESLALSPDGTQAAVTIRSSQASSDIWLADLQGGVSTRFTFGPGRRRSPLWSPDSSAIVFVALGGAAVGDDFLRRSSSGAGADEMLVHAGANATPLDISLDGKLLVYSITGTSTKDDLWLLPLQGPHTPRKYLDGPSEERQAQFSPDGQWIAYSSDETGQFQVYVQTVPATGAKRQISTQGGSRPRWRRDGKELYYLSADGKLIAVPVKLGAGTVEIGAAERLFELSLFLTPGSRANLYAPSANGQTFLAVVPPDRASGPPPVTIWMNWMTGIGR